MNSRLAELHRQRARLQERIAIQRADLAEQFEPLRDIAESGYRTASAAGGALDWLRNHPLPVAAAVAALALLKPALAGRWALRGVGLWRTWRTIRNLRTLLPAALGSLLGRWL